MNDDDLLSFPPFTDAYTGKQAISIGSYARTALDTRQARRVGQLAQAGRHTRLPLFEMDYV